MGWLWATPSPPRTPASGPSQPDNTANQQPPPPATDSDIDPELQKFIALFQAELNSTPERQPKRETSDQKPSKQAAAQPAKASSWWSSLKPAAASPSTSTSRQSTSSSPTDPATPINPLSEALLPNEMSCREAFDRAFHCQSLGGQWTAIYRDGALRDCSERWNDFWFCMRTKGYGDDARRAAVRARYRARELERYGPGRPSSEDVWEARTEMLQPGEAFCAPYEPADMADVEWQRVMMERKRAALEEVAASEEGSSAPS